MAEGLNNTRLVDTFRLYTEEVAKLNSSFLDDVINFVVTPYFIPLIIICFTFYSIYMHKRGKRAYHILDTSLIISLSIAYVILLSIAISIQKPLTTAEDEMKTELFFSYFKHPDLDIAGLNLSLGDTPKEHQANKESYEGYGVYLDIDGDDKVEPVYVKKTKQFAEGTVLNLDLKESYLGVLDWSKADPQVYMYQTTKGLDLYVPLSEINYVYIVTP